MKWPFPHKNQLIWAVVLATCPYKAARADDSKSLFGAQIEQYGSEATPVPRFDLRINWTSEHETDELPGRELHIMSFYEAGPGGDYSFDIDKTVIRVPVGEASDLWFGRSFPLADDSAGKYPTPFDAIGANWVQNQSDALSPRVSGWIGLGGRYVDTKTGFSLSAAFSPLFLPSFGPGLQLSSTGPAEGSRFAHLPPQYVNIHDQLYPLRYEVDTGSLWRIVDQPQAFLASGFQNEKMKLQWLNWTAPNPNPNVSTAALLQINAQAQQPSEAVNVLIDASPDFERQYFTALTCELKELPWHPLLSATYEFSSHQVTAAAQSQPATFLTFGALHHFVPESIYGSATASPAFADRLFWVEFRTEIVAWKLIPSFRIERNFGVYEGQLLQPKVVYHAATDVDLYTLAQIMSGADQSYFGTWRSLGSVAAGAAIKW